ncbi:MAG: Snf7 family protein [Candidatus Odinarchaeota archaeon]|nr:Snf7 family protein [Candidatus Odinarchaeota archaeon]
MGLLDGLKNWLSPKKSTQDLIIQLKVFSEMLDLSTQEIREKAQSYRNKAVKYAKQGDRTRARQYLKLYHQFSAQAMGMEEYKANLDLLTAHLEEASVMKQSINAIREIRSTLKGIILSLPSIPSLQKEARKLNKMVEQLGTVREETIKAVTPNVKMDISDEELDKELDQIMQGVEVTTETAEEIEFPEPLKDELEKAKKKLKKLEES